MTRKRSALAEATLPRKAANPVVREARDRFSAPHARRRRSRPGSVNGSALGLAGMAVPVLRRAHRRHDTRPDRHEPDDRPDGTDNRRQRTARQGDDPEPLAAVRSPERRCRLPCCVDRRGKAARPQDTHQRDDQVARSWRHQPCDAQDARHGPMFAAHRPSHQHEEPVRRAVRPVTESTWCRRRCHRGRGAGSGAPAPHPTRPRTARR